MNQATVHVERQKSLSCSVTDDKHDYTRDESPAKKKKKQKQNTKQTHTRAGHSVTRWQQTDVHPHPPHPPKNGETNHSLIPLEDNTHELAQEGTSSEPTSKGRA